MVLCIVSCRFVGHWCSLAITKNFKPSVPGFWRKLSLSARGPRFTNIAARETVISSTSAAIIPSRTICQPMGRSLCKYKNAFGSYAFIVWEKTIINRNCQILHHSKLGSFNIVSYKISDIFFQLDLKRRLKRVFWSDKNMNGRLEKVTQEIILWALGFCNKLRRAWNEFAIFSTYHCHSLHFLASVFTCLQRDHWRWFSEMQTKGEYRIDIHSSDINPLLYA